MLNNPDPDLLLRSRIGDETVATTPDDDQPDVEVKLPPDFVGPRPIHTFDAIPCPSPDGDLDAGETVTYVAPYPPDIWLITIPNIVNVNVEVTLTLSDASWPHARLGPGGFARLPGRGNYVTLKNIGSAACVPVVTACKGWGPPSHSDFYIDVGEGTVTK